MNPIGDPNPGETTTGITHFSFLSPTTSNLANLDVAVPPGFNENASPKDVTNQVQP